MMVNVYLWFPLCAFPAFPAFTQPLEVMVLATQEELPRQRVMVAVEELGTRGASGVLEVTGIPGGAIYLEGGRITFAKASWVPGPAARLRGIQPVPPELAELLSLRGGEDDAAMAALIAHRGYLTTAGLHELIQSIVIDVLLVLTIPLAPDSPGTAVRFASTRGYWPDKFPRLDVAPLRAEAGRRASRMAQCDLAPTTAVALHWLRLPAAVLTSEQWAIARQLTGPASAQELALRSGHALADTMECLGGLMRAGLCAPVRIPGQRRLLSRAQQAVPQPVRQPVADAAPPGPAPDGRGPRDLVPTGPDWHGMLPERPASQSVTGGSSQGVPLAILRQVLEGLKKL
jgi:hypothetical protein